MIFLGIINPIVGIILRRKNNRMIHFSASAANFPVYPPQA
jgi:hypothetical protein